VPKSWLRSKSKSRKVSTKLECGLFDEELVGHGVVYPKRTEVVKKSLLSGILSGPREKV